MNRNTLYHDSVSCRYLIRYHVIWCPRVGESLWTDDRRECLTNILRGICHDFGYEILFLHVTPDFIHVFVDVPETAAPCDVARTLRTISIVQMLRDDPEFRKFYQMSGAIWNPEYFISTMNDLPDETVADFVSGQKRHKA